MRWKLNYSKPSPEQTMPMLARRIRVTGIVQGVGFRPFVWRLAQERQLSGWVRNDSQGVVILVQGEPSQMDDLIQRLHADAPPLARVDTVLIDDVPLEPCTGFLIVNSLPGQASTTIGPDVGVCADCVKELFDPTNKRWRHAFITCTHCGPRYTITHALPYDRPQTSMAAFPLCTSCGLEYTTPVNRRFHAETTCCPHCGPQLSLTDSHGDPIMGDPIAITLKLMQTGRIVAIKGLGGFHLACDARNAEAVARLRRHKNREAKPLAVMLANVASVGSFAQVTDIEKDWLQSRERPIVLLRAHDSCDALLPSVAPGLRWLGVMLPTTPIHYLLFHEAAGRPGDSTWLNDAQYSAWVMTSANPGGEPIVRDMAEAPSRLTGIADAFLSHDRAIVARCDDSVIRSGTAGTPFIRRSRGYAPIAIRLPSVGPSVLAFGSHFKNTVCLTRGDEAFLSPHVGDLDNAASCAFQDETVQRLLNLLEVTPEIVVHDLHPDDYSTRAAQAWAQRHSLPCLAVQHHHAHIAAVCADRGWQGPVLGLALDGFGLGCDGQAWGGELLYIDGAQCSRQGHLRPLPLPGGDRAAREPWRMAAAVLHQAGLNNEITVRFADPAASTVASMLQRRFNSPMTSSMGRLFDAAAGLLGLCSHIQYEAQAAILLEQAATQYIEAHGWPAPKLGGWCINSSLELDFLQLLATLQGTPTPDFAAARVHATLIAGLTDWVMHAVEHTGVTTLALSGGCFMNALVLSGLNEQMAQRGITVLTAMHSSPGDGSIALGQAWVARHPLD